MSKSVSAPSSVTKLLRVEMDSLCLDQHLNKDLIFLFLLCILDCNKYASEADDRSFA